MTITKQPYQIVFLFLLLLPCHALSSTEEGSLPPYRFSTFGTLGIAYTPGDISPSHTMGDKNSFHDHFSWPYDSLLGLQADIQFTPSLSATAQLVLKERVDNSLDETLEWAFVRWRPNDLPANPDMTSHVTIAQFKIMEFVNFKKKTHKRHEKTLTFQ